MTNKLCKTCKHDMDRHLIREFHTAGENMMGPVIVIKICRAHGCSCGNKP